MLKLDIEYMTFVVVVVVVIAVVVAVKKSLKRNFFSSNNFQRVTNLEKRYQGDFSVHVIEEGNPQQGIRAYLAR